MNSRPSFLHRLNCKSRCFTFSYGPSDMYVAWKAYSSPCTCITLPQNMRQCWAWRMALSVLIPTRTISSSYSTTVALPHFNNSCSCTMPYYCAKPYFLPIQDLHILHLHLNNMSNVLRAKWTHRAKRKLEWTTQFPPFNDVVVTLLFISLSRTHQRCVYIYTREHINDYGKCVYNALLPFSIFKQHKPRHLRHI